MHKMPRIKAIAIDLDGTALLPDTTLGERTTQCLKGLIARNISVIICTGRSIESSYPYCTAMGAQGPMVFFNGAIVADMPDARIIKTQMLGLDVVEYGLAISRSMDIHFQAFFPPREGPREALLIDRPRPEAVVYQRHTGITAAVTDMQKVLSEPGLQGCIKAMFICDPALHDEIRCKILERFGSRVYITRSHPTFLELMDAGVSKGEGLKTVMNCRGLRPEEVLACGDEENDLPMFDAAGLCAAPSSARESVQQAADYIFGPPAEEGLAIFLAALLS